MNYKLPIENKVIKEIRYNGSISLCFESFMLRINHFFIWNQHNYKDIIDVDQIEELQKMFNIFRKKAIKSFYDESGNLFIKFENDIILEINEECRLNLNPHCEYWHFYENDKLKIYERLRETIIL